jgi:hypothetical protein
MKLHRLFVGLGFAALLTACGGGGSAPATGPVSSSQSFPLKSAYSALIANGYTKSYDVSGSCKGFASETTAAPTTGQTFNGVPALSTALTLTINLTTCPSVTATVNAYYDSNFTPLGFSSVNGSSSAYSVYLPPLNIPAMVMVGNTGTIGTATNFTDSSKVALTGQTVFSYAVEPDTASSAIVNLIFTTRDTAGNLTSTEQDRYRISATGALSPVSKDTLTPTTHLILQ